MSRLKQFMRSLISGYAVIIANALHIAISVPLALHYLTRQEFGLWQLVAQLTIYLALVDLGVSGVSRILVDHKDTKADGRYGSAIQTTFYVSLVQGVVIAVVGLFLSRYIGSMLDVPAELNPAFSRLIWAHALILAATFATRILSYMLAAHQRYDICNYSQIVSSFVNLAVLWLAFQNGAGLYSVVWSQGCGAFVIGIFSFMACLRLRLFPARHAWGKVTWASFKEIFKFGQEIFFLLLGYQMVTASQAILLTRLLGLEAVSLWAIGTRLTAFMNQIVFRIFDYSCAALAEMLVRREAGRLLNRFRELVALSSSIAVFLGAVLIVCNQPFITLWTNGRFSWPRGYDALMAAVLFVSVCSRIHIGLIGQTKLFHGARYIYLAEAMFFILLSVLVVPQTGMGGMFAASCLSTVLFSGSYGVWRTSRYFGLPVRDVLENWLAGAGKLVLRLIPFSIVLVLALQSLPPLVQLMVGGLSICAVGGWWLFQIGLPTGVKHELETRWRGWKEKV
ncbi:MAG TPA: oligosaccharide flippase family protein [Methylomirabilota bacterium]|nr:oligosaccharide flippase family protein [Methylomirabilota bacterium]